MGCNFKFDTKIINIKIITSKRLVEILFRLFGERTNGADIGTELQLLFDISNRDHDAHDLSQQLLI